MKYFLILLLIFGCSANSNQKPSIKQSIIGNWYRNTFPNKNIDEIKSIENWEITRNKISLRLSQRQVNILETIGEFKPIDLKNKLYELVIKPNFIINDKKGIKKQAYDKISRSLDIAGQYRTYDWRKATRVAVFLEPIRVFTQEAEDEA